MIVTVLRTHDTAKANPPMYKQQKCLVGIKYHSYFNAEFFFQYLLMNLPHRNLDELEHPNHDILPDDLKYFASCAVKIPDIFTEVHIRDMLQNEGHKTYFINNVINYIENLRNVYHLWQIQVLQNDDFLPLPVQRQETDLDPMQKTVVDTFKSFLQLRAQYYESLPISCGQHEMQPKLQSNSSAGNSSSPSSRAGNDWVKIISITGKPGTGKTKCLHCCIQSTLIKN